MSAVGALYRSIREADLDIQSLNGFLHVQPSNLITPALRGEIIANKDALLDLVETIEERAALMEFDGQMDRPRAEAAAMANFLQATGFG